MESGVTGPRREMRRVVDKTYWDGETVEIDDTEFIRCEFLGEVRGCEMKYYGGGLPVFTDCTFENTKWRFGGAAWRTLTWLQALFQGRGGETGKEAARFFVNEMRAGKLPEEEP